MALINCPDCGTDVSDACPACMKCGRPIAAAIPAAPMPQLVKQGAGCVAIGFRVVAVGWLALGLYVSVKVTAPVAGQAPGGEGVAVLLAVAIFFFPGLGILAIGEFLARRGK